MGGKEIVLITVACRARGVTATGLPVTRADLRQPPYDLIASWDGITDGQTVRLDDYETDGLRLHGTCPIDQGTSTRLACDEAPASRLMAMGPVSRWRIQIPASTSSFDLTTIPDVILHVTYAARISSTALRDTARARALAAPPGFVASVGNARPEPDGAAPALRIFNARRDYSDAWARFNGGTNPGANTILRLEIDADRFPGILRNRRIQLLALTLSFVLREGANYPAQVPTVRIQRPGDAAPVVEPVQNISHVPVVTVALNAPVCSVAPLLRS